MPNEAQISAENELQSWRNEFDKPENLLISGGVATKPFLRSVSIIKKILTLMEEAAFENKGFHLELFYDEESPTVKYYLHTTPRADGSQSKMECPIPQCSAETPN